VTAHHGAPMPSILPWQYPSLDGEVITELVPEPVPQEPPAAPVQTALPLEMVAVEAPAEPVSHVLPDANPATAYHEAIERGHAEGYERGVEEGRMAAYAAGFAEGRAAGEAALAGQVARLVSVIANLSAPIATFDRAVEDAVVALALEVARCVIGGEVARSREYLVRLVHEAIAKVPIGMTQLRLLLNPGDLDLVRKLAPDIEEHGGVLVGDDNIEAGGCVIFADVEGGAGSDRRWRSRSAEGATQVDLTLPFRWRAVLQSLFEGADD